MIKALFNFYQQLSVADLAYFFTIIEGLATVIAAVGAIMAVVITKKIANEQIEIAKKQNKISDKQANIAVQQNEIALFDKKFEAYRQYCEFLTHWRSNIKVILEEKDSKKRIFACLLTIENCSSYGSNIDALTTAYFENDCFPTELSLFLFTMQKENVFMLFKLPLLFQNVQTEDIEGFIDTYQTFISLMRRAVTGRQVPRGFVKAAEEFKMELQKVDDTRMLNQMKTELRRIEV